MEKNSNQNIKDKNASQSNANIINNESKDINKNSKNNLIKFRHYLSFLLSLKKNYPNIKIYMDFRKKMISEENIILNNLNIDKIITKYKNDNTLVNQELEFSPKLNSNN